MFTKNTVCLLLFFMHFNLFAQSDWTNWLKYNIGEVHHIWQYRANVREESNINSTVIAVLSRNDRIEIVENSDVVEQINDVWGYWVKIKYGNIIGYTFSGNIATSSLSVDLDRNGINDYFHFRRYYTRKVSGSSSIIPGIVYYDPSYIDPRTDIIIFINNQRVNTEVLKRRDYNGDIYDRSEYIFEFDDCIFECHDDFVLIGLITTGRHSDLLTTVYKIDGNGVIEYFGYGNLDRW